MEVLAASRLQRGGEDPHRQKYIIPKQLDAARPDAEDVNFTDDAIRKIIADYTREAGLRNLEREIASICRKAARKHAEGHRGAVIEPERGRRTAGPVPLLPRARRSHRHSRASPLAWRGPRQAARSCSSRSPACPAKGMLTLTGLLGESMRESAQAAL